MVVNTSNIKLYSDYMYLYVGPLQMLTQNDVSKLHKLDAWKIYLSSVFKEAIATN